MAAALLGRKVGMTRVFDHDGVSVPVTIIEAGPCFVSQIKSPETDGYSAVQLAFGSRKARTSTMPVIGHDAKAGLGPMEHHREFRVDASELESLELGGEVRVDAFESVLFVDVIGVSKGKGYQGTMKRHGFKGQLASHGVERKHRSPGSICARSSNTGTGKPKKGIRMAGQMGGDRVTVRSLPVIAVKKDENLLVVKGPVPGPNRGLVMIREAKRLYKGKARKVAEAS